MEKGPGPGRQECKKTNRWPDSQRASEREAGVRGDDIYINI